MTTVTPQTGKPPLAPPPPAAPGFSLADIYYTLFRHWRLIAICAVLSLVSGGAAYFLLKPKYVSTAKLLIRFVLDKRPIAPNPADSQLTSPDSRGENLMNSEVEILGSADLAVQVATLMGPEKILAKAGGGTNLYAAAGLIRRGTTIDIPRKSNVILVQMAHPDPEMAQPILRNLLDAYISKHIEIHRNSGVMDEFLRRQRDQLSLDLSQTEGELRDIRTNLGIVSIEESKKLLMDQISKVSEEIVSAEAQLAEARAAAGQSPPAAATSSTNAGTSTNTAVATTAPAIPPAKLQQYRTVQADLQTLRGHEHELQAQFTPEHPTARRLQVQLAEKEARLKELETEYPRLEELAAALPALPSAAGPGGGRDLGADLARTVPMLLARIAALTNRFDRAHRAAAQLVDAEIRLNDLQRKKELKEANYRYYQSSLDQVAVDEALGPGKVSNINKLQEPTPPAVDMAKLKKPLLAALFGPLAFGLALAFLLDMFLDQSVKRPSDIERKSSIPLFASIPNQPRMSANGDRPVLGVPSRKALPEGPGADAPAGPAEADAPEMLPSVFGPGEKLRPYAEVLRDRLVTYFDLNNLFHKPKLVAITGCHRGAGATTVATALAASLSETGDGNVLLVDMRPDSGVAQQFLQGKPQFGLLDALDLEKRGGTQIQDKLYLVAEHEMTGGLSKMLPKRFAQLLPRLRLSDYDYIIFDLPEMSRTSTAPRVGRFMDLVLLVAEAERTNIDLLRQSAKVLAESGATVGAVLNRTRQYVPARLSHELT